jgi:hypothetical protein
MVTQTRTIPFPRLLTLAWLILTLLSGGALAQESGDDTRGERVSDQAAIESLLKDQTLYGHYVNGLAWSEYHSPDGRTAYRQNDCVYAGHWWVAGGLVCFRYDAFNWGRPACFRLYLKGDRLSFYYPSLFGPWILNAYSTKRLPGNPEKMPVEGQSCVGV